MGYRTLILGAVLLGLSILTVNVDGAHFCYKEEGCAPRTWPGVCQTGTKQSPVNIKADLFDYIGAPGGHIYQNGCYSRLHNFTLKNNGHSAQAEIQGGQTSTCTVSGDVLNGTYVFAQMHFHWGSTDDKGSEHTVNGQRYAMEGHLVHYKSDYASVTEAVASKDPHGLTVLGVVFKPSLFNNPALDPIISQLRRVRNLNATSTGSGLDLSSFLPKSPLQTALVAQYDGSLTTPDCNESVLWNFFVGTVPISEAQLKQFRSILGDEERKVEDNFRALQPLNGRKIRFFRAAVTGQ